MTSSAPAPFDTPGRIKCGTITTPDFDASLGDYRETLGFTVVETGPVAADLAASWGAPGSAGRRSALLQPASGTPCFIRLVEGSRVPAYRPLRSFGWASFEISVRDVFALRDRIGPVFEVIGQPRHVDGFSNFIPMQVRGRAGEILYLNQVLEPEMAALDLPPAVSDVDSIFIAILAAGDRQAAIDFHTRILGFEAGDTHVIPYRVINDAFGLPADHRTVISMTKVGRLPGSEIDQYPPGTIERPRAAGELPPGNAMLTFMLRSLDAVDAPFLAPPAVRDGPLYAGRRTASVIGAAGELIELIETAS